MMVSVVVEFLHSPFDHFLSQVGGISCLFPFQVACTPGAWLSYTWAGCVCVV